MNRIILISILALVLASSQVVGTSPRVLFEGNYLTNNPKIPNFKA